MKQIYSSLIALIIALTLIAAMLSCSSDSVSPLVVIEKQDLPVVYFRVMVSAGSAFDPEDKPGLAYFTANLLNKGTLSYSREEIENRFDQIGAEFSIHVDKEVVVFEAKTLKENLDTFYPIFKEILTSPSFPSDQVALMRSRQLDRINQVREDDRSLSLAVFENELFRDHRYGHLIYGAETAVKSFSKEDAATFYRQNYLQGNVIAGVAGAVDDELAQQFESDLTNLPRGSVVRVAEGVPPLMKKAVILIEKENRTQSHLRIGHRLTFNRTSSDHFPMRLAWAYLGEHREMFGRLFETVRKQRGLAYGAYAYTEYFRQAGWSKLQDNGINRRDQYFHMWSYSKVTNFKFCIKLMLVELTKLTAGDVPETNYATVRDYVANNFAFLMETPDKQLGMRLDEIWYGQKRFVDGYTDRIGEISQGEMIEKVKKYLRPEDVLIVAVVSNGAIAKAELLNTSTTLDLPSGTTEGELKGVNDQIKAFDLDLKAEDITIVKASELFK